MNCQVEYDKNYDVPVLAGNWRVLLGMLAAFAGLYISVFTDFQGHGLGLLLIIASPFVFLTDRKRGFQ